MKYNPFGLDRIQMSDRYYNDWADKFRCQQLEEYYENFQHKIIGNEISGVSKPYVLNLVFTGIQTKMANMLLNSPQFEIQAIPRFSDWDQETAFSSATLKQDALNTVISNPNLSFVDNVKLSALDHFFRFAVMEVGYAADWQNPNTPPPIMKSDVKEDVTEEKDKIVEEIQLPTDEHIFFRWISARRFRVSVSDSVFLHNCAWAGYYSFFYKDVLENIEGINFEEYAQEQRQNPQFSPEYRGPSRIVRSSSSNDEEDSELQYLIKNNEVVKMWTIWNNKTKQKLLVHGLSGKTCWETPFSYLPFATHRANYRLKGWYPIPPVWYWLSPQNEINEVREQMRNYRRRFKRKFGAIKGKVALTELDKMSSDVDGEMIEVKEANAIFPIGNPEIGISIEASLSQTHADFNLITGTSQARESDRETATKSKIISLKEQARENVERQNFDSFVCETARLGLVTMSERLTLPMWIKYTVDPSEQMMGEINDKGPIFRQIMSQELDDGYDFTVAIKVVDGSDMQMEAELQKFIAFNSLIMQFPHIALSPVLIREAAYKTGYRNEKVIKQMQQMALLHIMGQAQQAQQAGGGNSLSNGNANKSALANSTPPAMEQMNQQLTNQQN